jgi:hypothetical protein
MRVCCMGAIFLCYAAQALTAVRSDRRERFKIAPAKRCCTHSAKSQPSGALALHCSRSADKTCIMLLNCMNLHELDQLQGEFRPSLLLQILRYRAHSD